jgi:hypothetical protein
VAASGFAELLARLEQKSWSESQPLASGPIDWQWHGERPPGKIVHAVGETALVDEPPANAKSPYTASPILLVIEDPRPGLYGSYAPEGRRTSSSHHSRQQTITPKFLLPWSPPQPPHRRRSTTQMSQLLALFRGPWRSKEAHALTSSLHVRSSPSVKIAPLRAAPRRGSVHRFCGYGARAERFARVSGTRKVNWLVMAVSNRHAAVTRMGLATRTRYSFSNGDGEGRRQDMLGAHRRRLRGRKRSRASMGSESGRSEATSSRARESERARGGGFGAHS